MLLLEFYYSFSVDDVRLTVRTRMTEEYQGKDYFLSAALDASLYCSASLPPPPQFPHSRDFCKACQG